MSILIQPTPYPVSTRMEADADKARRRRWLRFLGGTAFLIAWSTLWIVILLGWLS